MTPIQQLKQLNAAYIASLEYDRCPDSDKSQAVSEMFDTGIPDHELVLALNDNQGRRPDEIAMSISQLIVKL